MSTRWYRSGLVDVTDGSKNVAGAGTLWVNGNATKPEAGDIFTVDFKSFFEIEAITDDGALNLFSNYSGATATGQTYAIIRNNSANLTTRVANLVTQALNQKQQMLSEFDNWITEEVQNPVIIHDSLGNELFFPPLPILIDQISKITFNGLADTPASYTGQAGNFVVVNSTEDGVEFATPASELRFNSVAEMKAFADHRDGSIVDTHGYYNRGGIGKARYRIWTLANYRTAISSPTWTADNVGDHDLTGGLVAILDYGDMLWAGQLGLLAPVDNDDAGTDHSDTLQAAVNFAKRELDPLRLDGAGVRKNIVLHVERGNYCLSKTVFVPANVMLCGGDTWGGIAQVGFIPIKPHNGGSIDNYFPKKEDPLLLSSWTPNHSNTTSYITIPLWTSTADSSISIYAEPKLAGGVILGHSAYSDTAVSLDWDASVWKANLRLSDGTILTFPDFAAPLDNAGRIASLTMEFVQSGGEIVWNVGGVEAGRLAAAAFMQFDRIGNDTARSSGFVGYIQYITIKESGANVRYYECIEKSRASQPYTTLNITDPVGSTTGTMTGFPSAVPWFEFIAFNENDRTGFMFIWNSSEASRGLQPLESVYLTPYIGGMSAISIDNYETNPFDSADPYNKNYLKEINGSMVYGGALFDNCRGERVWTFAHRPAYETLNWYVDAWEVKNYKCNTPIENEKYQFDMNGTGDAVHFEGCQFPVNHPDATYPDGEYPNGVVKGIKFQNAAFFVPNWKESTSGTSAGLQISRCINGDIYAAGVRSMQIDACHFEFGRVVLDDSSASISDCYFSQITEVGSTNDEYFDIELRRGEYGTSGKTLTLKNCEFHRGFDNAHMPTTRFNLVTSDLHTIDIEKCYQSFDLAGSGAQNVAMTVGYRPQNPADPAVPVEPLIGWERWGYLWSTRVTIVRDKVVPNNHIRQVSGFSGFEDRYVVQTPEAAYWTLPTDQFYYYTSQILLDKGDDTIRNDPGFLPLGRDAFVGYESDGVTPLPVEQRIFIPNPVNTSDGLRYHRPILAIYGQSQTLSNGIIRAYRGTSPGNYSHYVDIPSVSVNNFEDIGASMYGREWLVNPSAPNVIPLYRAVSHKRYQLETVGGQTFDDSADLNVNTGRWVDPNTTDYLEYDDRNGGASASRRTESTSVWNAPLTADRYCGLKVTGELDDNGDVITIPEGATATIVRTEKSTGDFNLLVQVGSDYIATLGTGDAVVCRYSDLQWTPINWNGGATSQYTEVNDAYQLLSLEDIRTHTVVYDTPLTATRYANALSTAEVGDFIRVVKTAQCTGTLIIQEETPGAPPATELIATLDRPSQELVLIKTSTSSWEVVTRTGFTTRTTENKDAGPEGVISPTGDITEHTVTYTTDMTKEEYYTTLLDYDGAAVGSKVTVYRASSCGYSAGLRRGLIHIRSKPTEADPEVLLTSLSRPNQFAEFTMTSTGWVLSKTNSGGAPNVNHFLIGDSSQFVDPQFSDGKENIYQWGTVFTADRYCTLATNAEVGTVVNVVRDSAATGFNLFIQDNTTFTITLAPGESATFQMFEDPLSAGSKKWVRVSDNKYQPPAYPITTRTWVSQHGGAGVSGSYEVISVPNDFGGDSYCTLAAGATAGSMVTIGLGAFGFTFFVQGLLSGANTTLTQNQAASFVSVGTGWVQIAS